MSTTLLLQSGEGSGEPRAQITVPVRLQTRLGVSELRTIRHMVGELERFNCNAAVAHEAIRLERIAKGFQDGHKASFDEIRTQVRIDDCRIFQARTSENQLVLKVTGVKGDGSIIGFVAEWWSYPYGKDLHDPTAELRRRWEAIHPE